MSCTIPSLFDGWNIPNPMTFPSTVPSSSLGASSVTLARRATANLDRFPGPSAYHEDGARSVLDEPRRDAPHDDPLRRCPPAGPRHDEVGLRSLRVSEDRVHHRIRAHKGLRLDADPASHRDVLDVFHPLLRVLPRVRVAVRDLPLDLEGRDWDDVKSDEPRPVLLRDARRVVGRPEGDLGAVHGDDDLGETALAHRRWGTRPAISSLST